MKIILVAAMSQDGYIADMNGSVKAWTSVEDQAFFEDIMSKHSLMVMGSRTFDASPKKPIEGARRVVLTRQPEKYASLTVSGQLEFRTMSPTEFVSEHNDYETCLLLGGGLVYEAFLDAGFVDEIYLTREPVKLKAGTPLLAQTKTLATYKLPEPTITPLNSRGTLLYHYNIKK